MAGGLLRQLHSVRYGQATYLFCVRPLVSLLPLRFLLSAAQLQGVPRCARPRLMCLVRGHAKAKAEAK